MKAPSFGSFSQWLGRKGKVPEKCTCDRPKGGHRPDCRNEISLDNLWTEFDREAIAHFEMWKAKE
jgi:hypothetical protein